MKSEFGATVEQIPGDGGVFDVNVDTELNSGVQIRSKTKNDDPKERVTIEVRVEAKRPDE